MRLLALLFLVSPCLNAQNKDDSFVRDVPQGYQDFTGAAVLAKTAPLYTAPDTNSAVLKKLSFLSPVRVIGAGNDEKTNIYWYKIESGNTQGFMRLQHLAQQSFTNKKTNKQYLFQAPAYGNGDSLSIYTYATDKKMFTDTCKAADFSAETFYRIEWQETALKNATVIIRITHIMPYCGGGQDQLYFVDANEEVSFLFSAFSGGDIGDYITTTVWLPKKMQDGKIQLTEQSDFLLFANDKQASNDFYPLSPSFDIPKEELVIWREVEIVTEYDEEDMPVLNEDGSEKNTIVKDMITMCRWNGKRLLKN